MRPVRTALLILPLLWAAQAFGGDDIAYLFNTDQVPAGVVFEIVESDGDALDWAIPRVQSYVKRLKARYPDLQMAVVSHGSEQFALQQSAAEDNAAVHQGVQSLLGEQVQLHVCGTHAGWYGVMAEDFPAYVDVAAAGPAQINDYEALGWEVVRVESPE